MRPAIKDRSSETFQLILVGLAGAIIAAVILHKMIRSQSNSPRPTASSELPPEQATQPAIASRQTTLPSPTYQASAPQNGPAPSGPSPEQVRRYNALQENCYRVTRMNSNGEYPALQTSACNDYARYAYSIGLASGRLPNVLAAQAPARSPSYAQSATRSSTPPAECDSLEQSKQQINAITRQALPSSSTEYYRERLREINARMWDLNCRNH